MNHNTFCNVAVLICSLFLYVGNANSNEVATEKQNQTNVMSKPQVEIYKLPLNEIRNNYAAHIESLLAGVKGVFKRDYPSPNPEFSADLCPAFFEDFKIQKGIKHIEPILVTQNRDDEQLRKYLSQIERDPFQGEVGSYIYRALNNFTVYKVDIDNNSENGKELGFYSEDYRKIYRESSGGGYNIYSFYDSKGQFVAGSSHSIHKYSQDKTVKLPSNITGLIEYKQKVYLFDLHSYGVSYSRDPKILELERYQKQSHGDKYNLLNVCRFDLEKEL